jgi:hypothetical protein
MSIPFVISSGRQAQMQFNIDFLKLCSWICLFVAVCFLGVTTHCGCILTAQ